MVITLTQKLKSEDLFERLGQDIEQGLYRNFESKSFVIREMVQGLDKAFKSESSDALVRTNIYQGSLSGSMDHTDSFYQECQRNIPKDVAHILDRDLNIFMNYYLTLKIDEELEMPHNLENKLGLYVSAVINASEEIDFKIELPFLGSSNTWYFNQLGHIGYKNDGKNIIISGKGHPGYGIGRAMKSGKITVDKANNLSLNPLYSSFGEFMFGGEIFIKGSGKYKVAYGMQDGTINVEGNIKEVGNHMKGGFVDVKGNVSRVGFDMCGGEAEITGDVLGDVGVSMKSGLIIVNGNINGTPGRGMSEGEIHINGRYFRVPKSATGGNIYRKGKLVMENGRKVK